MSVNGLRGRHAASFQIGALGYVPCDAINRSKENSMAEIQVGPTRRNRAIVWIVIVAIIIAVAAWYFLAGPGKA